MNIQEYISKILPQLEVSRTFTSEQRAQFEQGLELISVLPHAQSFIKDSRRFRDYHRRTQYLRKYLEQLVQQSASIPLISPDGKRRVGRPTKEEQNAYRQAEVEKAKQEAEAGLFPDVKPDTDHQRMTYNGIVANPNGESIAATMPHLNDIRWFLSEGLQARVSAVRDLRNEMASKAEQAKTMAEANGRSVQSGSAALYSEEEIAALATRAVEIESDILPVIFNDVDREMGEVYLRLSERTGDPEYIEYVAKHISTPTADLRTKFKCFYEKAQERDPRFSAMVAEKIANDRPEVKAQREADAKHKAEADAIIKYIIRKDKPATKTRVKGLQERIEKLRKDYSDIVTEEELAGYQAVLVKTIEDLEKK